MSSRRSHIVWPGKALASVLAPRPHPSVPLVPRRDDLTREGGVIEAVAREDHIETGRQRLGDRLKPRRYVGAVNQPAVVAGASDRPLLQLGKMRAVMARPDGTRPMNGRHVASILLGSVQKRHQATGRNGKDEPVVPSGRLSADMAEQVNDASPMTCDVDHGEQGIPDAGRLFLNQLHHPWEVGRRFELKLPFAAP